MSPFINNLISHPKALERIQREIQEADKAGRLSKPVVMYEETTQLPFFSACIKETLRRDAPAVTILPRIVSKPGYHLKCFDGEHFIPAGTEMGASPFIIHRDTRVFGPDPEEWRPERWIQAESGMGPEEHKEYVSRMEKYGMWWGYGDRECAGKYYALMEIQKLCTEMLRRFDMASADPEKPYHCEKWAVGMFWNQRLEFTEKTATTKA